MAWLRLQSVTKVYADGTVALRGLSLAAAQGEFLVLVGPSGCGKTTTLRLIAGLEEPTEGEIWLGGRCINGLPPRKRDVAMVFQNYALYPHMTVYDNLAFGLRMRRRELGLTKAEIDQRVRDVAEMLGIGRLLDKKPAALSGGERQRVALGRAIVRRPAVFLFDEPLSNLDAQLRAEVRRDLKRLHAEIQTTMVYVTHDQIEAMTLGDRVAVLRDGQLQQVGTPQQLYDRPENLFVACFLGSPRINTVEGELVVESGRVQFRCGAFRMDVPPGLVPADVPQGGWRLVWAIRPEHISLARETGNNYNVAEGTDLAARVTVVEPWGREQVLYCDCGGVELTVLCPAALAVRPGQQVLLRPLLTESLWFDPTTGRRMELGCQARSEKVPGNGMTG